jgi:hypothetical protein
MVTILHSSTALEKVKVCPYPGSPEGGREVNAHLRDPPIDNLPNEQYVFLI